MSKDIYFYNNNRSKRIIHRFSAHFDGKIGQIMTFGGDPQHEWTIEVIEDDGEILWVGLRSNGVRS